VIRNENQAPRTVPTLRGRFGTEEPSHRPLRKEGRFRGRFVQMIPPPTSDRQQRGQDWPASVRAAALLLPFAADGPAGPAASSTCTGGSATDLCTVTKAGVAVVPADVESPARAVRSFDLCPETRTVWLGLGSWNQRGASHRICVRGQRVPRRVLIGNQADGNQADLSDASAAGSPCRVAGTVTAASAVSVRACVQVGGSPRPQRSSGAHASALPRSWPAARATAITTFGGPIASRRCIGLASSTATKIKIGRSGPGRCAV
jgi:hypothetical protein